MAYIPPTSGELREKVTFQREQPGAVVYGEPQPGGWAPIANCVSLSAKVAPVTGGETVLASRLAGVTTSDFTVRSTAATRGINVGDQVIHLATGIAYNIRWIANLDLRSRFLVMTAESGVTGAAGVTGASG